MPAGDAATRFGAEWAARVAREGVALDAPAEDGAPGGSDAPPGVPPAPLLAPPPGDAHGAEAHTGRRPLPRRAPPPAAERGDGERHQAAGGRPAALSAPERRVLYRRLARFAGALLLLALLLLAAYVLGSAGNF